MPPSSLGRDDGGGPLGIRSTQTGLVLVTNPATDVHERLVPGITTMYPQHAHTLREGKLNVYVGRSTRRLTGVGNVYAFKGGTIVIRGPIDGDEPHAALLLTAPLTYPLPERWTAAAALDLRVWLTRLLETS